MEKISGVAEKEFESSFDGYWLGTTHNASKQIERLTDDYKISVLKRMFPLNPEHLDPKNKNFARLPNALIVSKKIDGGFYTLNYAERTSPKSVFCNSPGGRAIHDLPVNKEVEKRISEINAKYISQLKELLQKSNKSAALEGKDKITSIVFGGELYANIKKPQDRPRVFDLIKLTRNPSNKEDLNKVNYAVFDVISINQINMIDISYEYRIELANWFFPRPKKGASPSKATVIEYKLNVKAEEIKGLYEKWVEQEYHEGIVVRTKYNMAYKIKPRFDVDAVIIGFAEMLEENKIEGESAVASLLVALMRDDGTYQELAHVGGGFTDEQRVDFHNLLSVDVVPSNYRATKGDGRAFYFVKPRYVIQVAFTDLIGETASGEIPERMALKFEDSKWEAIDSMPFPSIISPRYELLRSEVDSSEYPSLEFANVKEITPTDVNVSQVTSIITLDVAELALAPKELPKVKILLKLAIEGKWAGVLSAKKLLLWATNKRAVDKSFPNYVVYVVDYNFTRSTVLEQRVYPFNDLEKAVKLANYLLKESDYAILNESGDAIKKSIVWPPRSLFIEPEIAVIFKEFLDPTLKILLKLE